MTAVLACAKCSAAMFVLPAVVYEVPALPPGQNWAIVPTPAAEPIAPETVQLPVLAPIVRNMAIREPHPDTRGDRPPLGATALGIVVATMLLLSGYQLIPRFHATTLRLRSLHVKQNLLADSIR